MAMKVYQNGDVCEIDKSGQPLLQIPLQNCALSIIGTDVRVFNQLDETISRTDDVAEIQNQAGTLIGDIYDVVKYLNVFIRSGFTNAKLDTIGTSSGGGGGETNTASNVGTGAGQVFKQKTGVDLEFKTIKAGTNITVTNNADDITIDASGGSGEVNTASNIGTGAGVFKQKTGVDLELRKINSNDFGVTENANDITVNTSSSMITNQASVTPASGMEVLLNDSGTLKRGDVSSFLGGGGAEPYEQDSFMHEYLLAKQKSANSGSRTTGFADGVARCNPFVFDQDVQIKAFGVNIVTPRTADAYFGIYEFTSNTTPFTGVYTFTKVYQEPTVFSPSVSGSNAVTLTTPYTCTAGTVYAVILVMDNSVGGNVQFQCFQNLEAHPLAGFTPTSLGASNKCRFFNASITITASTLPSTIDFNVNTDNRFSGACYLKLKNV